MQPPLFLEGLGLTSANIGKPKGHSSLNLSLLELTFRFFIVVSHALRTSFICGRDVHKPTKLETEHRKSDTLDIVRDLLLRRNRIFVVYCSVAKQTST